MFEVACRRERVLASGGVAGQGRPPSVAVCDQRYVFNPMVTDNFDPNAPCPPGVTTNVANVRQSPAKLVSLDSYPRDESKIHITFPSAGFDHGLHASPPKLNAFLFTEFTKFLYGVTSAQIFLAKQYKH